MLAVSGNLTFALYLYNNTQWSRGGRTVVGYFVGNGKDRITINGSFTVAIQDIDSTSNVGKPGLWVFQIDHHSDNFTFPCQDSVTGFELILE